jgi:UDP-glucose:(heptosyl)LPS alpha-1,3-glucosyltransferase
VKFEIMSYYGKPFDRIRVIYNGYKPPAVAGNPRETIRRELGLSEPDVLLLFTGSGWERKGLAQAVRAASLLRTENVRLVVAGRGKRRPSGSSHVRYLGAVQDMAALYEAADLFILPTFYDPFSNASLEAAAHGLPVITTTANGFSEIMIHGWCGEVVTDPRDIPALADAVRKWLPSKKRQDFRDRLRHWARDFRVGDNVDRTLDFLLS